MRLASSKTMLFLNDSWMAQLGSENVLQKTTSSGRLSAGGEAWSRSQTLCISQTRRKQQTGLARGFHVWHWLALLGEVGLCWSEGYLAEASTKTHTSQLCRFKYFVATKAAIFKGSRLRSFPSIKQWPICKHLCALQFFALRRSLFFYLCFGTKFIWLASGNIGSICSQRWDHLRSLRWVSDISSAECVTLCSTPISNPLRGSASSKTAQPRSGLDYLQVDIFAWLKFWTMVWQ